jgi:hypothetical protein
MPRPVADGPLAPIDAAMHVIRAGHKIALAQQPLDARRREST